MTDLHSNEPIPGGVYWKDDEATVGGPTIIEAVEWPARRVSLTFTHQTCGDEMFCRMIAAAALELSRVDQDGELMEFTAANGVHIKVRAHVND